MMDIRKMTDHSDLTREIPEDNDNLEKVGDNKMDHGSSQEPTDVDKNSDISEPGWRFVHPTYDGIDTIHRIFSESLSSRRGASSVSRGTA